MLRVEQAFVHIDVDDLGALLDLLARDRQSGRVVAGRDQLAKLRGAGDVGPLTDVDERDFGRERERLQAREAQLTRHIGNRAGAVAGDGLRDRPDVIRGRAAAAADNIDQAGLGKFAQQLGHVGRDLVVVTEFVRQAGIRVSAYECIGHPRQFGDVRAHLARAERTVEADRQRPGMCHGIPKCGRCLARQQASRTIGDRT